MKILYFAWIREKIGVGYEEVLTNDEIRTVKDLAHLLAAKGGRYYSIFSDLSVIRVAVNQEYVSMDHSISPDDEIAFFPPVTGG